MNITIIGTGNVATVVGHKLLRASHKIVEVYGRSNEKTGQLAKELKATPCYDWSDISKDADLYIIAISDNGLYELPDDFRCDSLVVHTAGSVSKDVLKKISPRYGIFYPLQSLKKNSDADIEIPFLVDANTNADISVLIELGTTISEEVAIADDNKRLHLHVGAVIVNNFTNHLFTLADDYCRHQNINFELLLPLIRETVGRLEANAPATMQTGPAIRRDVTTIEKHLQLLQHEPQLKKLYKVFSDEIMERYE
ncbi:Rossmann-like and DUF2520 domain-containing protein [Pinibacter aurantiacus]|uniref:DUF2520 domain-containing protein n=1 Tax=Pinibacter aurantiacus TaxID=2851599 RepID=A0A9E2S6K8_9BACT|nr:Rossmann-like and DUF2520 domain-containing protein [Pinibacter aurantiacus]MBV4356083.1 DUF2520 domain-containing protein [Pinibacter aurantiacus]